MSIVHRYWTGPAAPNQSTLHDPVRDWTDGDVPGIYLELADTTAHLVLPDPVQQRRHRSNVVRLGLLYEHGGWWADHDLSALASFTELPSPATASHGGQVRCNCWLAFPAGHPALLAALDAIAALPKALPRPSPVVAGEAFLDRLWGAEIPQIPVFVDIDGTTNRDAPPVLVHRGVSANRATVHLAPRSVDVWAER